MNICVNTMIRKPLRRQRWKWQYYVKINHRETGYRWD